MNDSFAQFVYVVERPELLRRWKRDAAQGGWTRIHGNFTIVLPIIVLLGVVLVMQASSASSNPAAHRRSLLGAAPSAAVRIETHGLIDQSAV